MKPGQEPDEWLMGQVALGNREHLEPLVRRFASPLLTFLQRMAGDRHRAEELFQEVFLAVWTKRKQYKFPRPFRCWLFAIAANHCRADFRKAHNRRQATIAFDETSGGVPVAAGPTPVEAAIDTETAALVADAVARLPTQQRSVLVLKIYNGMNYAEIAQIVGKNEGTVRSHMHHALAAMRRHLEPRM